MSHFKSGKEFFKLQFRPILQPRRFQAYCVGTAKSGTHLIAELFKSYYRVAHEPESEHLIDTILATQNIMEAEANLSHYVRTHDRNLWLEIDSSQLNYFFLDILISEFPNAKFILTIRDCYSWIDSFINHQLSRPCSSNWRKLREFRFKHGKFEYVEEEQVLAQNGLYTLDGYLSYWAEHNNKVLTTIPSNRLLVIKTHEINTKLEIIANFLDVSISNLNLDKAHSFKAKKKFNILSKIAQQFFEAKVDLHCKSLMDEFFPNFSNSWHL